MKLKLLIAGMAVGLGIAACSSNITNADAPTPVQTATARNVIFF